LQAVPERVLKRVEAAENSARSASLMALQSQMLLGAPQRKVSEPMKEFEDFNFDDLSLFIVCIDTLCRVCRDQQEVISELFNCIVGSVLLE
jgi:hypothetical protein